MNSLYAVAWTSLILALLPAGPAKGADLPRPWLAGALLNAKPEAAKGHGRRVLYNNDGQVPIRLAKVGDTGPAAPGTDQIQARIDEVAYKESRVDTVLVCINAQCTFYPSEVGTMAGVPPSASGSSGAKLKAFFDAGTDPYAVMLAETERRGREALISFRMNDDHGVDMQRTQFWVDHPECRLGRKALDFGREEVRDYIVNLIEEAMRRYDCDGIELDFNRFPTFFKGGTTEERVAKMNSLVERVRRMLDKVGEERGRRLVLAVRVPSNYNRAPPTPQSARQLGCDVPAWAGNGWVDFITVSEWLHERGDLPVGQWKHAITTVPVYFGIECAWPESKRGEMGRTYLNADDYRRAADDLIEAGADGIYLFNFFCGPEPPFEVLRDLGRRGR